MVNAVSLAPEGFHPPLLTLVGSLQPRPPMTCYSAVKIPFETNSSRKSPFSGAYYKAPATVLFNGQTVCF